MNLCFFDDSFFLNPKKMTELETLFECSIHRPCELSDRGNLVISVLKSLLYLIKYRNKPFPYRKRVFIILVKYDGVRRRLTELDSRVTSKRH